MKTIYGNPSSMHSIGELAHEVLVKSRKKIADYIGCLPTEIIFTSGACESNTQAIKGYMDCHKTMFITSPIEHKSISMYCKKEKQGYIVPVASSGRINLEVLEGACKYIGDLVDSLKKYEYGELSCPSKDQQLVSIQSANSEIGTIQNIKEISNIVHKNNGIFHTDATQYFPYYPVDVNKMGIDMLSMSGQKIGAPKGIGFLYVKHGIHLKSIIYGSQNYGIRGGTENIPYIAGLAKAIDFISYDHNELIKKRGELCNQIINSVEDCIINGSMIYRLPNNINISFKGIDGNGLVLLLDQRGICCSTGSACNNFLNEPSDTQKSIGVPNDYINGTIRLTLSTNITYDEIHYVANCIAESIQQYKKQ